jgi:hypothetical protein
LLSDRIRAAQELFHEGLVDHGEMRASQDL